MALSQSMWRSYNGLVGNGRDWGGGGLRKKAELLIQSIVAVDELVEGTRGFRRCKGETLRCTVSCAPYSR